MVETGSMTKTPSMIQLPNASVTEDLSVGEGRFHCQDCQRSFARSEHLRRHSLTHNQSRPFQCAVCKKDFFRKDAVQRHLATHENLGPTLLQKGVRACRRCAVAKVRCSGGTPCSRCYQRSFVCQPGSIMAADAKQESRQRSKQSAQRVSDDPSDIVNFSSQTTREPRTIEAETSYVHLNGMTANASPSFDGRHSRNAALLEGPLTHSVRGAQLNSFTTPASLQTSIPSGQQQDVEVHTSSTRQSLNQPVNAGHGNTMLFPGRMTPNVFVPTPDIYDIDSWNSNPLSTINWLTDAAFDFNGAIGPLPLNESVYFQDFPHVLQPYVPEQNLSLQDRVNNEGLPYVSESQMRSSEVALTHRTLSSDSVSASEVSHSRGTEPGSGQFYVDSDSGRLPRVKRRRYTLTKPNIQAGREEDVQFSLLPPANALPDGEHPYEIQAHSYDNLFQGFQQFCTAYQIPFTAFATPLFPPKAVFDYLITLYFQSFHPTFPFLHASTFVNSNPHWLLILAMAGLGAHYLEPETSETFCLSLHEFLRRILFMAQEDPSCLPNDPMIRTQITLLHTIGMMYSGSQRMQKSAFQYHYELVGFCTEFWKETPDIHHSAPSNDEWLSWRDCEMRHRTGYCIWLLDCMWKFQFDQRPLLSLEHAKISLPCHEALWGARHDHDWRRLKDKLVETPSLLAAVNSVYIEKTLPSDIGEFSQILLIHALFQRSWNVEAYFGQHLSFWEPTASRGSTRDLSFQNPIWLPSIPTYAKWRNSTCDCLDILHWSANAAIGNASGLEHPTILHLHLARLILLTPFRDIIKLATYALEAPSPTKQTDMLECEQTVRKWATQDQYKARLAMIHAGVTFWHIRRFSVNAYYEPFSTALATLALWAFATFHNKPLNGAEREQQSTQTSTPRDVGAGSIKDIAPRRSMSRSPNDGDSDLEDPVRCEIILLDRPTDDELVQNFVRYGHTMTPNLGGVGNLYGEKSPELVLREGRRILYGLSCWGVRRRWLDILDALLELSKRKRR